MNLLLCLCWCMCVCVCVCTQEQKQPTELLQRHKQLLVKCWNGVFFALIRLIGVETADQETGQRTLWGCLFPDYSSEDVLEILANPKYHKLLHRQEILSMSPSSKAQPLENPVKTDKTAFSISNKPKLQRQQPPLIPMRLYNVFLPFTFAPIPKSICSCNPSTLYSPLFLGTRSAQSPLCYTDCSFKLGTTVQSSVKL